MTQHAIDLDEMQERRTEGFYPPSDTDATSEASEQKLGEFCLVAGGIAHDFNNALTVILGNAAMLERDLPGGSPERDRVARIVGSARQASLMAESLSSVASREHAQCAPLALAPWLDSMHPRLAEVLGARARLEIEPAVALPCISADPAQLERLLSNLLSNARTAFADGEGVVSVRTGLAALERGEARRLLPCDRAPRGLCVYLEVENDGPMLRGEARTRLFEPFFTTRPGALGLGLAAVLRIVQQHRAAIEVENEPGSIGRGVRFRIWFPALAGS